MLTVRRREEGEKIELQKIEWVDVEILVKINFPKRFLENNMIIFSFSFLLKQGKFIFYRRI